MRRGLKRVGFAVVSAISWCFKALAARGWGVVPLGLSAIIVLAWAGVALTRGRNWFAILAAFAITASFVPVIRRERSRYREVRAALRS